MQNPSPIYFYEIYFQPLNQTYFFFIFDKNNTVILRGAEKERSYKQILIAAKNQILQLTQTKKA